MERNQRSQDHPRYDDRWGNEYGDGDWEQGLRGPQPAAYPRYLDRDHDDRDEPYYAGTYTRSARPYSYPGGGGIFVSESMTLHGPYTGKGPKHYKRSDAQICEEASQRLERDGRVDASEIEVSCTDGVLALRGKVEDRRMKRAAEDCVEDVYGVADVMNELEVEKGFFKSLFSPSPGSQSGSSGAQR